MVVSCRMINPVSYLTCLHPPPPSAPSPTNLTPLRRSNSQQLYQQQQQKQQRNSINSITFSAVFPDYYMMGKCGISLPYCLSVGIFFLGGGGDRSQMRAHGCIEL